MSPQLSPNSNPEIRVVRLSIEQEQVLEAQFGRVKNPHSTDLVLLAAETGLLETDVQVSPDFHAGVAGLNLCQRLAIMPAVFHDIPQPYKENY
jgi:hypothetical protein